MLAATWLRPPTGPGVLLLTAHVLALDPASWRIALGELDAAWHAVAAGREPAPPREHTTYRQWSQRLRQRAAVLDTVGFWSEQLDGDDPVLKTWMKVFPGTVKPLADFEKREDLRQRFTGSPEKVINLMSFIAEEVREVLASLGLRTLDEAVGRTDLLRQISRGNPDLDDLDLNPLLAQIDPGPHGRRCSIEGRNPVPDTLDAQMVKDARPMLEDGEKMQLAYNVRNVHRAVGTRLSAEITRRYRSGEAHVDDVLSGP